MSSGSDLTAKAPKCTGVFYVSGPSGNEATVPVEIKSITTDSEGVRRIRITSIGGFDGGGKSVITEPKNAYNTIWMPKGAEVVYLPADFVWIPLKTKKELGEFFT